MSAPQGEARMLIDGELVDASNGATFDNINPATEEVRPMIVAETGSPVALTYVAQLDEPINSFGYWIELAKTYKFERDLGQVVSSGLPSRGVEAREPIGVVGAITPFNFPLMLTLNKIGPALAAGCTIVHKAATETP